MTINQVWAHLGCKLQLLRAVTYWNSLTITTAQKKESHLHKKVFLWCRDCASRATDTVSWEDPAALLSCEASQQLHWGLCVFHNRLLHDTRALGTAEFSAVLQGLQAVLGAVLAVGQCSNTVVIVTTHSQLGGTVCFSGGRQSFQEWARPVPFVWGWPKGHHCLPALQDSGQEPQSSLQPAGTALPLAQGSSGSMELGQWHGTVLISYSSYENPPGNLLLKQTAELRCGLASPLLNHYMAMFQCRGCPCSIPWQGREWQTK